MTETTGGLTTAGLAEQAANLRLPHFSPLDAIELGLMATRRAIAEQMPIIIEIRMEGRILYRAALPGSKQDSEGWIDRKARVVESFGVSSLQARVQYEEQGTNFHDATGLSDQEYAPHGGGHPIEVLGASGAPAAMVGGIYASGLPQVQDHEFITSCLMEFKGIV